MGTYFNPPEKLPEVARLLSGKTYEELVSQLEPGEELFGHYRRPLFENAVWLYSPEEFGEFESQVQHRVIVRLGFYAMPETTFKERVKPLDKREGDVV